MRILFLLLLLPSLAVAQISGLSCTEIGDRQATLKWINATATTDATWISFDTLTSITRETNRLGGDGATTARTKSVSGLAPSTRYYFNPNTTGQTLPSPGNCPGTCTNCGSTDWSLFADSSGCDCDVASNPPSFVTAALDQQPPIAPTHNTLQAPPSTFATDQLISCAGLQAAMTAIPNDAANHRIRMTPGTCEVGAPLLPPNLTAGGVLLIEPDVNVLALPPAILPNGQTQQIDPRYAGAMVVFTYSTSSIWWQGTNSKFLFTGLAEGLFTRGVGFILPDLDQLPFEQWTVTAVDDANDRLTIGTHDLVDFETVYISATAEGFKMETNPGAGLNNAIAVVVGLSNSPIDTFTMLGGPWDLSGWSSGGTVTRANSNGAPISTISGNLVTTTVNHGLPNYPTAALTSISGTTLTTATDVVGLGSNRTVVIKGSGTSDGAFYVVSGTSSPYTLASAPGDCSAGCASGTAQRAPIINIGGTTNANFPYPFTVPAANQLTLEGATGLSETAGYAVYQPSPVGPFLNSDGVAGLTRTTISQALFTSPGFPWRLKSAVGGAPTSFRVQGYWATGVNFWCQINPQSKNFQVEDNELFNRCAARFAAWENGSGAGDGVATLGMLYDTAGIPYFIGDQGTTAPDFSFNRNTAWRGDRMIWGTLNNHTRFYLSAQAFECKGCERVDLSGNFYRGWAAGGFVPNGWTINLSARQGSGGKYIRDINLDYSVFDYWTGSGVLIDSADNSDKDIRPFQRISLNHVWYGSRFNELNIDSPIVGSGGLDGGTFVFASGVIKDLAVNRSTVYHQRAQGPFAVRFGKGRTSAFTITDTIFAFDTNNTDQFAGMFAEVNAPFAPSPVNARPQGNDAWDSYVRREPTQDTVLSSFLGNVLHGGVREPQVGDFDAKMATVGEVTDTVVATHYAGGFLTGNFNIVGASGNDRENAVYQTDSFTPQPTYANKGADLQAIADQMLRPGPVTVSVTPTSITISYRSPTADGCIVDLSSDQFASQVTRQQDSGTGQDRSATFAGLTAQRYDYRIHCGAVGPSGYATPGS